MGPESRDVGGRSAERPGPGNHEKTGLSRRCPESRGSQDAEPEAFLPDEKVGHRSSVGNVNVHRIVVWGQATARPEEIDDAFSRKGNAGRARSAIVLACPIRLPPQLTAISTLGCSTGTGAS